MLHTPLFLAAIALVAGGVIFAKSAFAQEKPGVVACQIAVYPTDPDPKGTNLRAGPGSGHRVVTVIKDDDSKMEITGSSGDWLRVRRVTEGYGGVLFKGEAWVFAPLTSVRAREPAYMYRSASIMTDLRGVVPAQEEVKVLSCSGEWVKIEYRKSKGWIAPNMHCGNAVTTCV